MKIIVGDFFNAMTEREGGKDGSRRRNKEMENGRRKKIER